MRFRLSILICAMVVLAAFGYAVSAELSAFEIAKKSLDLEKTKHKIATYKMTVVNDRGKTRNYQFKVWEKEYAEGTKKMVRFFEPSDANGTGLLTHERKNAEDLQWLFLPAHPPARQLAAGEKSDQFMGSDLFIEDMGEVSAEDYEHKLVKEETVDGVACYVVESKPKTGVNTAYGKSIFWIDKSNFASRKAEIYDKGLRLLKTLAASNIEQVSGIWTIKKMEVSTPAKKTKTLLELVNVQYDKDVPDNTFTTQSLEKY